MFEALGYSFVQRGLWAALGLAVVLGALSPLVMARRMAFFSAAIGQAALTGVSLGVLVGENVQSPYFSVAAFCLCVALGMTYVRRSSRLPWDTLVGVLLALTLGLGVCLLVAVTRRFNVHQLEAVMFGSLLTVTRADLLVLAVACVGVLVALSLKGNAWYLDSVDAGLARAAGLSSARLEYGFVVLLTFALVVSLKVVGALMVESLLLVPAAAARNLSRTLGALTALSILFALLSSVGGVLVSTAFYVPVGAAVVLLLSACFFSTWLVSRWVRPH